jgi:hypothetical protein
MATQTPQSDLDDLAEVGIGPVETGVPLPRAGGFLGRLRRSLERLAVGDALSLHNVTLKQERYIRARLPVVGRDMEARYSVHVATKIRDRSGKRTLRVHRVE